MPRISTLLGLYAAFAITISASAQTEQRSPGTAPNSGQTMAPPPASAKPKIPRQPVAAPVRKATALTEDECGRLGGIILPMDVCMSGKMCNTTGEDGKTHQVCIRKVQ